MTPSRPSLNGSRPPMEMVPEGARRLPERRRRSVVLPAPLAPMKSVRDAGGRERVRPCRPMEWSGKEYERFLTTIDGAEVWSIMEDMAIFLRKGGERKRVKSKRKGGRKREETMVSRWGSFEISNIHDEYLILS